MVLADGSVREFDRDHPWFTRRPARAGLAGRDHPGDPAHAALAGLHLPQERGRRRHPARTTCETWNRDAPAGQGLVVPPGGAGAGLGGRTRRPTTSARAITPAAANCWSTRRRSDTMNATVEQTLTHHARGHQDRRPRRQAVPHRHPVPGLHRRHRRHLPGLLPRASPPRRSTSRSASRWPRRRGDREDQGLARRDPAADALPGHPALHRRRPRRGSARRTAQETCYFGFVVYYSEDGSLSAEGESFLRAVERLLAAEGGRPHWGKYFDESLYDWPALYPALGGVPARSATPLDPHQPLRQRVHRRAVRLRHRDDDDAGLGHAAHASRATCRACGRCARRWRSPAAPTRWSSW